MTNKERLERIKQRLKGADYYERRLEGFVSWEDVKWLVEQLEAATKIPKRVIRMLKKAQGVIRNILHKLASGDWNHDS